MDLGLMMAVGLLSSALQPSPSVQAVEQPQQQEERRVNDHLPEMQKIKEIAPQSIKFSNNVPIQELEPSDLKYDILSSQKRNTYSVKSVQDSEPAIVFTSRHLEKN